MPWAILSDWKNCSILKSLSISSSEMLQRNSRPVRAACSDDRALIAGEKRVRFKRAAPLPVDKALGEVTLGNGWA
jgi:hypothetical protein